MQGIYEGIYRHYTGNLCRVICGAKHTQTQEDLVVYEDVSDGEKAWALPLSVWNEEVCVDGKQVLPFQYLAKSLTEMDEKPLFKLIEAIVEHMEMYDRTGENNAMAFYEKATGEVITVWHDAMGRYEEGGDISEYPPETVRNVERILDSPKDFVRLLDGDSVNEYDVMESFCYEVPVAYQQELLRAIEGKGAFRRFKDTAIRLKLIGDWYVYKKAAYRKEAREWCDFMKLPWSKEPMKGNK